MQTMDLHGNPVVLTIKRGTVVVHGKLIEMRTEATDETGKLRTRLATTTVQEFWLGFEDGSEEQITLTDNEFVVQAGHQVSLCLAGIKDHKEDQMVGLVNHNTGKSYTLPPRPLPGMQISGLSTSERLQKSILAFLPGLVLLFGFIYIGREYTDMPKTNLIIGVLCALGFLAYGITRWRRLKRQRDTADTGLGQAIAELMKQVQNDTVNNH